jgi:hypothetical protein
MNIVYKEEDATGKTQVILKLPAVQLLAGKAKKVPSIYEGRVAAALDHSNKGILVFTYFRQRARE